MAVASLSKLTVPLPAGQSSASQGLLMPKLKYRFRVTLQNFGVTSPTTELTKQVMSCTRPEISFETIVLDVYNSKVKLAGKYNFTEVTLKVRDDATGAVSKLVGEQVQKQYDFFEQASAASGIDYKFTTMIEILDGGNGAYTPTTLETFELTGAWLSKVTYSDVDYKSNDPVDISMSIVFDNATQLDAGGNPVGIGENVGRTVRTMATG